MKKLFILVFILGFSQFGFASDHGTGIKVETVVKTTKSWDGTTLPHYIKGQPEVTILKITIPPHTKLAWHKHTVINAGILLKGHLTVKSETNKVLNLKAGDSIVELVETYHYGINEYDEPAVIVVFYAGEKGKPITLLKQK